MSRIRGCIAIVGITGTVAGVMLIIVAFTTGEWRLFPDAQVTQFFTCAGQDPSPGSQGQPLSTFEVDAKQIYACGYLKTSSSVRLGILIFSNHDVVHTIYPKKFEQGQFIEPLCSDSPCTFEPGHYRVDIERGRKVLGSAEFTVTVYKP